MDRTNIWAACSSETNEFTIKRKLHTEYLPAVRWDIGRFDFQIRPRPLRNQRRNIGAFTAPPAEPLPRETLNRHLGFLALNSRQPHPNTKRRISLISGLPPSLHDLKQVRIVRDRPLVPTHPLVLPGHTLSTNTPKHRRMRLRRRRSTQINNLRITRRSRRNRRQQRLQLLVRQLLRLIKKQIINSETTTRTTRPSNKLDRTPVSEDDRFLPIRLPDRLNERGQFRILTLILKKRLKTKKSLPRCLNLMSRMQDLPTLKHHLVQLRDLHRTVLTVLARNR